MKNSESWEKALLARTRSGRLITNDLTSSGCSPGFWNIRALKRGFRTHSNWQGKVAHRRSLEVIRVASPAEVEVDSKRTEEPAVLFDGING